MAYNSDGYIMIDFTEVDFRRTNQTIDGLYKRCVDVIGTNKFILVINANGRTPLPATCSFTNNQYVIDTCIYMFAISSNDNLFIRRNDVPASDIIDDSSISVNKTWSSNKIDTELDGKADTSALADYQPLLTAVSPVYINADNEISVDLSGKQDTLTPVSPVSINADNEISVDLSGKQNVLTAGANITITNDVISAAGVKSFTYVGNGVSGYHKIDLPADCHIILAVYGFCVPSGTPAYDFSSMTQVIPIMSSGVYESTVVLNVIGATQRSEVPWHIKFSNGYIETRSSSNQLYNLNQEDVTYTVYYI